MVEFIEVNPKEVLSASSLQDLDALVKTAAVKTGLSHGGWIAGGAIRALLCGTPLSEYFAPASNHLSGDVDIFFGDASVANCALKCLSAESRQYTSRSYGGSAMQLSDTIQTDPSLFSRRTFTVQYVDNPDFCIDGIQQSLLRFDFVNCMIAFDGRSIIMPKNWHELESKKLIQIHNTHSPFLATRLKKYVGWRGYTGITPDSREIFADWLVRSLDSNNFSNFGRSAQSALEKVKDIGHLMTGEELLLFIGKWNLVEKHKSYGHMFEENVDWALSQIQKTSKQGCSNQGI